LRKRIRVDDDDVAEIEEGKSAEKAMHFRAQPHRELN
jgi:hypothetical protein